MPGLGGFIRGILGLDKVGEARSLGEIAGDLAKQAVAPFSGLWNKTIDLVISGLSRSKIDLGTAQSLLEEATGVSEVSSIVDKLREQFQYIKVANTGFDYPSDAPWNNDVMIDQAWDTPARYRVFGSVTFSDKATGQTREQVISFYLDENLGFDDAFDQWAEEYADRSYATEDIVSFQQVAVFHRKGASY